jgi:FkbM family methyltransferase
MLGRTGYESEFQQRMLSLVYQGASVWDVGANVGYYTKQFSAIVGKGGQVAAIEPNPSSVQMLRDSLSGIENVVIVPMGLGSRDDRLSFDPGVEPHSVTGRIVDKRDAQAVDVLKVAITTGERLLDSKGLRQPNVIKIDTEGYELDVLQGMGHIIADESLRAVCVEVHFGLLAERGLKNAPAQIEALLSEAGFSIEWPDSSHLVATRGAFQNT